MLQLGASPNEEKAILEAINEWDKNDSTHCSAPLKQADGAIFIDSSKMEIDTVKNLILMEFDKKQKLRKTDL